MIGRFGFKDMMTLMIATQCKGVHGVRAALGGLAMAIMLAGCGGEEAPEQKYEIPAGASAEEISPGEPITPPAYQESSGLPGPPPGPPPVR